LNEGMEKERKHPYPPENSSNTPTPSKAASNGGGRVCAQCGRIPPDGKEEQFPVGRDLVWLHRECRRFYTPAHDQRS
jgi:hypothetical protein